MKKASILVIDDEPDNFDVIETFLSDNSGETSSLEETASEQNLVYRLHYVASAQEAIAALDIVQPDLILLDVMMPIMDGIEACQKIKSMAKWQAVPIIMVTALGAKTALAHCLNAGADDFISKPVNSIELRARVHSMLRIRQQYRDIQTLSQIQKSTIALLKDTFNELHGNIASNLTHEVNTPLHSILGAVELIQDNLESKRISEVHEMLGWIDQSARRLATSMKKFLTYLELSTNQQQPIELSQTRWPDPTIEAALKSRAQSVNRGDDLVFKFEEAEVGVSAENLLKILYELVDNALKFSPPKTPIQVSSQAIGNRLDLSVQNLGQGMTASQIAAIDAPIQLDYKSYTLDNAGLGLRIVKKIVESVGGEISITSVQQQQTTVNLSLPMIRG